MGRRMLDLRHARHLDFGRENLIFTTRFLDKAQGMKIRVANAGISNIPMVGLLHREKWNFDGWNPNSPPVLQRKNSTHALQKEAAAT